jgi:GT2 family glycosyltransferase
MSVPSVSVIISVFGQLQHTKRCLAQLEKTLDGVIDYEVLIIDDASKDGTVEFLKGLGEPYRVFFNDENQGFAKNNNLGSREARGEYLCLLNNDVFVQGDWFTPMLRVFEQKEKVGMVGNVQKLADSNRYDHMGVVFSPQGKPCHFGKDFFHRPFGKGFKEWNAVTAACCLVNRERFLDSGGFDEVFVNGYEDIDLCLRMLAEGFNHFVAHESVVEHVRSSSYNRSKYNRRNEGIFEKRWSRMILEELIQRDERQYASWYFQRCFFNPAVINPARMFIALCILVKTFFK